MTRLLIIIILTLSFYINGQAQSFVASPLMEKTVLGNQYGSTLQFQSKKGHSIGVFYQTTISNEYDYSGLVLNMRHLNYDKLSLYSFTRIGLANARFFVVAPAIETRYSINKNFKLGGAMGIRAGEASIIFRLILEI